MAKLLTNAFRGLVLGDADCRLRLLRDAANWLVPGYRLKWPHMAWWHDEEFTAVLEAFREHHGFNTDRRWMMQQLMRLVEGVEGQTAECGVWRGLGSYIIARVNRASGKARTHFVFDSFEGLSEPSREDGGYWEGGDMAVAEDIFRKNVADYLDDMSIHKGWIPDCFEAAKDERFAFVHIDVDLYRPTLDSFEFFYPRLNEGGIILCDDYGLTSCPGATQAMDEFLADKPEKAISLSAGSGFFVKGLQTAAPVAPLPAVDEGRGRG
jgi:hypothetical protein